MNNETIIKSNRPEKVTAETHWYMVTEEDMTFKVTFFTGWGINAQAQFVGMPLAEVIEWAQNRHAGIIVDYLNTAETE